MRLQAGQFFGRSLGFIVTSYSLIVIKWRLNLDSPQRPPVLLPNSWNCECRAECQLCI